MTKVFINARGVPSVLHCVLLCLVRSTPFVAVYPQRGTRGVTPFLPILSTHLAGMRVPLWHPPSSDVEQCRGCKLGALLLRSWVGADANGVCATLCVFATRTATRKVTPAATIYLRPALVK